VIQRAAKRLELAPTEIQPVVDELNDFAAAVELLADKFIIPVNWYSSIKVLAKQDKIAGTVTDDPPKGDGKAP
jgi:hypothetical protein